MWLKSCLLGTLRAIPIPNVIKPVRAVFYKKIKLFGLGVFWSKRGYNFTNILTPLLCTYVCFEFCGTRSISFLSIAVNTHKERYFVKTFLTQGTPQNQLFHKNL